MPNSDTSKRDTTADKALSAGKDAASKAAAEAVDHAEQAAADAAQATDQSYEELRAQVETLKQDLVGLADAARSAGAQTARQAYGGARRASRKAAAAAEDGYDFAGERLDDAFTEAEDFVRERPAVAMGLAASAGFLLAMSLLRR